MLPLQGCIGFSAGISINMSPLQGNLIFSGERCYKHTVPPGLKRVFGMAWFVLE